MSLVCIYREIGEGMGVIGRGSMSADTGTYISQALSYLEWEIIRILKECEIHCKELVLISLLVMQLLN